MREANNISKMAELTDDIRAIKTLLELNIFGGEYKNVFKYILRQLDKNILEYDEKNLKSFKKFIDSTTFSDEYKKYFSNIYDHINIIKIEKINIHYYKDSVEEDSKEFELYNMLIMSNLNKYKDHKLILFFEAASHSNIEIKTKSYTTSRYSDKAMIVILYITPSCLCSINKENPKWEFNSLCDYIRKNEEKFKQYDTEISIYDDRLELNDQIKDNIFNLKLNLFNGHSNWMKNHKKTIKAILKDRNYCI